MQREKDLSGSEISNDFFLYKKASLVKGIEMKVMTLKKSEFSTRKDWLSLKKHFGSDNFEFLRNVPYIVVDQWGNKLCLEKEKINQNLVINFLAGPETFRTDEELYDKLEACF